MRLSRVRIMVQRVLVAVTVALSFPGTELRPCMGGGAGPRDHTPDARPPGDDPGADDLDSYDVSNLLWLAATPTGGGGTTRRIGTPAPPRAGAASARRCSARHG